MSTKISIRKVSGYPTQSVMQISVSFTVTYAGNYHTEFDLYQGRTLVDTLYGNSYTMAAGGSKSGLHKTFENLEPGTDYQIKAYLCNSDTDTRLDVGPATLTFTTEEIEPVAEVYYAELILHGNGGKIGSSTTKTYSGWMSGWDGYAYVDIAFDGSGFTRSGYTLLGFSTSSSATDASYDISDEYRIKATSTDDTNPTTKHLYAVWSNGRPDDWEWNPAIVQGNALSIKASHWNAFIDRIQEFADYLGVSLSSATISAATATSGTRMMASQANAARTLISKLSPPTALPAAVSSGIIITAAFMNGLKNSLNSIS